MNVIYICLNYQYFHSRITLTQILHVVGQGEALFLGFVHVK